MHSLEYRGVCSCARLMQMCTKLLTCTKKVGNLSHLPILLYTTQYTLCYRKQMRVTAIFLNITQNHHRVLQPCSYSQKKPDILEVCYWILKHIQNLIVNGSSVQATQGQCCKGAQWSQVRPSGIEMLWGMWEVSIPTRAVFVWNLMAVKHCLCMSVYPPTHTGVSCSWGCAQGKRDRNV